MPFIRVRDWLAARGLSALAALVLGLGLGACGGTHRPGAAAPAHAAGDARVAAAAQATVRTANCRLWNVLGPGDRRALVLGLRAFFGGRVDAPGQRGQVLPDKGAYKMLNAYCRHSFARAFMLYRLYGDAAAFTPTG